jgi:hypothetical protein
VSNITVEKIDKKVKELIEFANTHGSGGVIHDLLEGIDAEELSALVDGQVMGMTATIADDLATKFGVPAVAVAGQAHSMALAHLALFLFAAGYAIRTDEFAAADSITEEDVDAAIASILGGSNG